MPRYSVIIPLYNKAAYIEVAVQSVLDQQYSDFEIVVVDDGSSDDSLQKAQTLQSEVVRVFSKTNGGTASARNYGIAQSRGAYCCFLDADDFWMPNFLEQMNHLIDQFPQAGLYANAYWFQKGAKRYHPGYFGLAPEPYQLVPNYFASVLQGEQIVTASSSCVSKEVLEEFGGFNQKIRNTEDQELWNKIALQREVAFCKIAAAVYRQDASGMKTKRVPKEEIEYARCMQEWVDADVVPTDKLPWVKKIIAANLIGVASMNLLQGDKATARKFLSDPRTQDFPERKAAWERLLPLPSFLIRILYNWRNKLAQRR